MIVAPSVFFCWALGGQKLCVSFSSVCRATMICERFFLPFYIKALFADPHAKNAFSISWNCLSTCGGPWRGQEFSLCCWLSAIKAEAAEEVEARDAELAVQIPGLTDESQGSNSALRLSSTASALAQTRSGPSTGNSD